jgi:hypothetical protein
MQTVLSKLQVEEVKKGVAHTLRLAYIVHPLHLLITTTSNVIIADNSIQTTY